MVGDEGDRSPRNSILIRLPEQCAIRKKSGARRLAGEHYRSRFREQLDRDMFISMVLKLYRHVSRQIIARADFVGDIRSRRLTESFVRFATPPLSRDGHVSRRRAKADLERHP